MTEELPCQENDTTNDTTNEVQVSCLDCEPPANVAYISPINRNRELQCSATLTLSIAAFIVID